MNLTDFHFDLPESLIARYPLAERSASRLLCLTSQGALLHRRFYEVLDLIEPGDLLIFNDTKVIPARLRGKKPTGGQVEILVERILDESRFLAQVRASKALRIGSTIQLTNEYDVEVIGRENQFYELKLYASSPIPSPPQAEERASNQPSPLFRRRGEGRGGGEPGEQLNLLKILESIGEIPLPPYMARQPEEADKIRYQTVYANQPGSVAAPTAGLHFDKALLVKLQQKGVETAYLTLHIGAGTFAPVRVSNIKEHQMHAEYIEVPQALCDKIHAVKAAGKRVIAVGTTTLRALESAAQNGELKPYYGDTRIFITPGHQFHSADVLITNLHLPQSTLLMLVSAFGGYENMMRAYQTAVAEKYRFYSYGDAMWVPRE